MNEEKFDEEYDGFGKAARENKEALNRFYKTKEGLDRHIDEGPQGDEEKSEQEIKDVDGKESD